MPRSSKEVPPVLVGVEDGADSQWRMTEWPNVVGGKANGAVLSLQTCQLYVIEVVLGVLQPASELTRSKDKTRGENVD